MEVESGAERDFLAPMPVDNLPGVGKQSVKVLKGLGVYTIGALSQVPSQTLKNCFGTAAEAIRRYANGIDDSEVLPPGEAKSISRETTFREDTRNRALLEATLWTQSEKVGADLRKRGKQARCITLKVRYADFSTITRGQTLRKNISTDQVIFETGSKLLNQVLTSGRQGVRLIGIGVSHLVEPSQQTALFTPSVQKLEKLNKTIDRIRDRYGFSAIQTGRTIRLKDILTQ
jgi:DNA polymerase-4